MARGLLRHSTNILRVGVFLPMREVRLVVVVVNLKASNGRRKGSSWSVWTLFRAIRHPCYLVCLVAKDAAASFVSIEERPCTPSTIKEFRVRNTHTSCQTNAAGPGQRNHPLQGHQHRNLPAFNQDKSGNYVGVSSQGRRNMINRHLALDGL